MESLVLSRRFEQEVVIRVGETVITVAPVALGHERVRLLFKAPRNVEINRREIDDRKQAQKGGAA